MDASLGLSIVSFESTGRVAVIKNTIYESLTLKEYLKWSDKYICTGSVEEYLSGKSMEGNEMEIFLGVWKIHILCYRDYLLMPENLKKLKIMDIESHDSFYVFIVIT